MASVIGFLLILGPLVVVHELGHFFFARLFNVKAEVFSVGFGPRIFGKKWGETEWRFSLFPLGGYVKLLGEEPGVELSPEDQRRSLHRQVPWKRFFIFFGGPLFNFIFAAVIYMAMMMIGEPHLASVVGRVVKGTPAYQAGFQPGDRILSVNGVAVTKFEEVMDHVSEHPGKTVVFEIEREVGKPPVKIEAQSGTEDGYSMYGEAKKVGMIEGLFAQPRGLMVGVSDPNSLVGREGIKTGDEVALLNGQTVANWELFEKAYDAVPMGEDFRIQFKLASGGEKTVALRKPQKGVSLGDGFGLYSSELFVEQVVGGSPADKAGLKAGDRVMSVVGADGPHPQSTGSTFLPKQTLESFFSLREAVQKGGEKFGKIDLVWEREGKILSAIVEPNGTKMRDPVLNEVTQYTIGVMPKLALAEPVAVVERVWNPLVVIPQGVIRMVDMSWKNFVSIGKMLSGEVSANSLGGPILIGKLAGESITRGLIAFLSMMAVLSVGLGVLNILPVPVLDGGHLMLLSLEMVRGKPLSIRQMEVLQQVGLSLILLLMIFVFKNDIMRLNLFN